MVCGCCMSLHLLCVCVFVFCLLLFIYSFDGIFSVEVVGRHFQS